MKVKAMTIKLNHADNIVQRAAHRDTHFDNIKLLMRLHTAAFTELPRVHRLSTPAT